jgi:hypothetical protein
MKTIAGILTVLAVIAVIAIAVVGPLIVGGCGLLAAMALAGGSGLRG